MLTSNIKKQYDAGLSRLELYNNVAVAAQGQQSSTDYEGTPTLLHTTTEALANCPQIAEEVFGPSTVAVTAKTKDDLIQAAQRLAGHLTATIHCTDEDLDEYGDLVTILERKVGRLIFNDYPTGVEVCHSMHHGGPFPATTDALTTSVGTAAIKRFSRPLCYQNVPNYILPHELRDDNPLQIWRLVNGAWTRDRIDT
jgi:NADP-dependent aldehyde dehydrogenase